MAGVLGHIHDWSPRFTDVAGTVKRFVSNPRRFCLSNVPSLKHERPRMPKVKISQIFSDITGHFIGYVAKELTFPNGKPTTLFRWATEEEVKDAKQDTRSPIASYFV
jgi:hypothetical protein